MIRTFGATAFGTQANGVSTFSLGKPLAKYPNAIATDAQLKIAVDRLQTRLASSLDSISASMTVASAAGIVANMLLSIDDEIVSVTGPPVGTAVPIARGFDGTTPALHLSSALVSGFIDAWHHNALVSEIEAIENALGANLSNIPASVFLISTAFKFAPQSPGGSLIAGANSITLTPVPLGVNGTDTGHYLYISGGTGAAEAPLIVGGAAVAGAPSGVLIIQCANAHSGAWTIQSATAGVGEAFATIPASGGGTVLVPAGLHTFYGPAVSPSNSYLRGLAGSRLQIAAGAWSKFTKGMLGTDAASYHDIVIEGLEIDGNQPNNTGVAGSPLGLVLFAGGSGTATRVSVRNCYIHGMPGNGTGVNYTVVFYNPSTPTTGFDFSNNTVVAEGGMGGGFLTTAGYTTILANKFSGSWGDVALVINAPQSIGSVMIGNYVEGNHIAIENSAYYTCVGNVVMNTPDMGIVVLEGGQGGVIVGNTVKSLSSSVYAITISNSTTPVAADLTLGPNTIVGPGGRYSLPVPFPDKWSLTDWAYGAGVGALTLGNGLNNNIVVAVQGRGISAEKFATITGPTAAFQITGFTGGVAGAKLWVVNNTSQTMTITSQSSSSSAGNQIANAGPASVVAQKALFIYDSTNWVLVASL